MVHITKRSYPNDQFIVANIQTVTYLNNDCSNAEALRGTAALPFQVRIGELLVKGYTRQREVQRQCCNDEKTS
jgi:hypothetical protein